MRPAPHPPSNMTHSTEDRLVADPFEADQLWRETARKNREIYTELFHPVPTNLVQNASAYEVCIAPFFHLLDLFTKKLFLSALYFQRKGWSCC